MKYFRITIKCSEDTLKLWRKYVILSESKDYEDALIKLLRDSGWLSKIRAVDLIQKDMF